MAPKDSEKTVVSTSTSGSRPASTLRIITLILLPLFSAAGLYGTWALAGANGTIAVLEGIGKQDAPLLPGTNDSLVTTYTGVAAVDKQLTILVVFFAGILGYTNDASTLFSIFGLGQFGAAYCVMMMESLRQGNSGRIISFVGTFGFFIQNIAFVVVVPWWAFLHILTSPTASPIPGSQSSSVLLISKLDLALLPLSLILGYIAPSVLMAMPSPDFVSAITHQQLIALWQPFPIWCILFQTSLRSICSIFAGSKDKATKAPQTALGTSYLNFAASTYRFIIGVCVITHLSALAIAVLPPSAFSNAAPWLQSLAKADFASVYIPYYPTLNYQVSGFPEGVQTFLQWDMYIGSGALLLWAVFLHRNTATGKTAGQLFGKVALWTLLAGPSGALAVVLWEREEIVKNKVKQGI